MRMFKRSEDGGIVCEHCLTAAEVLTAAELLPHLFPGTYHRLTCLECLAAPKAAPLTETSLDSAGGSGSPGGTP